MRPSELLRFSSAPFRADAATEGCQTLTYSWKFTDNETLKGQVVYKGLYLPGAGAATVTAECSRMTCGLRQVATKEDTVTFTVLGGKKYDDLKKRISECTGVVCLPALLDEANRRVADLEKQLASASCAAVAQCVADTTESLKRARGDQSFAKDAVEITKFTKDAREFAAALNALTEVPWLSDAIREFKAGAWTRLAQLEADKSLPPIALKYIALSNMVGDLLVPSTLFEGFILADVIRGLGAYGRLYGPAALDAQVASIPLTATGGIDVGLFKVTQAYEDLLSAAAYSDRTALLSGQLAARQEIAARIAAREINDARGELLAGSGNIAVAKGEISGFGPVDLRALSRPDMDAFEGWVKGFPRDQQSLPWTKIGPIERDTDTEYKILDYLSHNIQSTAKGEVWIYTERLPCLSCQNAAIEFERAFPRVDVKFFSSADNGYYIFTDGVAVFKPLPQFK